MKAHGKGKQEPSRDLGLKYIKRHNSAGTQGWYVAFLPRHTKESKFWADRKHGGREQALKKALAWRDAIIRKYRIPATPRRLPVPWTRCSSSGIRGVYLNYYGWAYVTQTAEAPGRYPRAYFGFRTHGGQRNALVAAVRHRITQEKKIYGTIVTPLPAWLAKELGVKAPQNGKRAGKPKGTRQATATRKGRAKAGR